MADRPVLVLGSASPARAALLRAAGVDPVVLPGEVDENALVASAGERAGDAHWLTGHLARAKAQAVVDRVRAGDPALAGRTGRILVLAADSMLAFGGAVIGKAASAEEVRQRWAAMAGHTAELVTGHVLVDVDSGRLQAETVGTTIRFGHPDPIELAAYIASGEPLAVAGSCTIDGLGGAFIDGLDGDHGNVIGLSLPTLRRMLAAWQIRWTDLWCPGDRPAGDPP